MSSWRPGDAPRGRRDYRDGPPQNYYPPQRYDDRRGRSRSRVRIVLAESPKVTPGNRTLPYALRRRAWAF